MPKTYICFVWHQHQPFYKDLISGEYHLPWTRMHGLKDYYGMVKVLGDFPTVHQTFNLVPSMLVQIEDYVTGRAADPFLRAALKPAEALSPQERQFILRYFFQAHVGNLIGRYPRYRELYEAHQAGRALDDQEMRDLQVLSQVAWFDEEILAHDREVRTIVTKGSGYSLDDQAWMGRKQREILAKVIPVHADFARRGQIEVSTTPFYHPILPLVCDTRIAQMAHPGVPLPTPFRYPQDAAEQLRRSQEYMKSLMGVAPVGLWPSEGSVSDEALELAAAAGFKWAATDNGVLGRTLQRTAGIDETYRAYRWRDKMGMIFRDHFLSDLIGFVYHRMNADEAARHFLDRIRENASQLTHRGEDALVPVILDGENAWEHYNESGRPFLRRLYQMIADDPNLEAVTVSEALARVDPRPLGGMFPGSWINANFDIWIGAEEDNQAWEYLLAARRVFEECADAPHVTPENRALAYEELLIAEGSDWNWWYGPEHSSDNEPEFDRLYRSHLANVYQALGKQPPAELSRPILRVKPQGALHIAPTGPVNVVLDGRESSYFEWLRAGLYRPDGRLSSMHGGESPLVALHYGRSTADETLALRIDLDQPPAGMRVNLQFEKVAFDVELPDRTAAPVRAVYSRMLEVAIPISALGIASGTPIKIQVSLWNGALPLDSLPGAGWLELL
jgi:alpha-amylase/alpha-mannosidase (GH57 family)